MAFEDTIYPKTGQKCLKYEPLNIYFIENNSRNKGRDVPEAFDLIFEEEKFEKEIVVQIDANVQFHQDKDHPEIINWNIVGLFIPEPLKNDKDKIITLVEAAFRKYGYNFSSRYKVKNVNMQRHPEIS